jgi:hypothetical protein
VVRARLLAIVSDSLLKLPLQSHPDHPPPAGLAVSVERLAADDPARALRLRYVVAGPVAALRWPAPKAADVAGRLDGLWRHSCFEAFVAMDAGAAGYVEFNFAPSGDWAAYRFDGYRAAMRAETLALPPRITSRRRDAAVEVEVASPWPRPGSDPAAPVGRGLEPAPLRRAAAQARLGLAAVLEAADGSLSYWALRHPPGRPDFHNEAGFQLEIEV